MPQARLPTAPRETVRAGDVVRGSLEGLRVRSRSGLKEGMPPRRCRGDPAGDPTTGPPGGGGCAGGGAAAEVARRSIDGSCAAAVGLDVSCSSCALVADSCWVSSKWSCGERRRCSWSAHSTAARNCPALGLSYPASQPHQHKLSRPTNSSLAAAGWRKEQCQIQLHCWRAILPQGPRRALRVDQPLHCISSLNSSVLGP